MEESAQILEVETFIPMLLQNAENGVSRLKRVMLIGDHHQLPPVVKNRAFQSLRNDFRAWHKALSLLSSSTSRFFSSLRKYGHLDQSLYARFVRLKTPTIDLNLQGRARPSIAELYSWRYRDLGNLPNVETDERQSCFLEILACRRYKIANPGFTYPQLGLKELWKTVEFIWGTSSSMWRTLRVEESLNRLHTSIRIWEKLSIVSRSSCTCVLSWLSSLEVELRRLMGIPAHKISILSTYNGQKVLSRQISKSLQALLRDVVRTRCAWNPLFGEVPKRF